MLLNRREAALIAIVSLAMGAFVTWELIKGNYGPAIGMLVGGMVGHVLVLLHMAIKR